MVHYPYRQRFQGTTQMQEAVITGDLYVNGAFTFGDAAVDTLILKGRASTGTAAGSNITIDSTYINTYQELWEMRAQVTGWGTQSAFKGFYFRTENAVAGTGKGLRTIEVYAMANATYSIGNLQGIYVEAGMKANGTQTIANANAIEAALAPYGGTGAITITNYWDCVLLTPSGVSSRIDGTNAAKINGIHLLARDGDGASTKLGDGFKMENDSSQSGTRTLTNGINIAIGTTYGMTISGASSTAAINLTGNSPIGFLSTNTAVTENVKEIDLEETITDLTKGARQGAIYINRNRPSTSVMTASDGNPDCALKMQIYNRSASSDYARTRGLEILAECRDTGAGSFYLEGAYVAVKNRSGTTMNNSGYMCALKAETNHNATGTCEVYAVNINDITQSSTASALYGIKVTTGNYNITRTAVMYVSSTNGSWTNILTLADDNHTSFVYAAVEGGCIGATRASPNQTATCDGSIDVLIGAKTLKIPLYNAVTVA